jgi:protease-4
VFHQSVWGGALAGKSTADVEALLDKGIYSMEKLKEGGWITDIKYADEIEEMLKKRIGAKEDKPLRTVDYRKYSRVKLWTLALSGGGDCIAVIRAAGGISRQQGSGLAAAGEGIASDTFIEKIRLVRGWFLSLVVPSVSTVLLD